MRTRVYGVIATIAATDSELVRLTKITVIQPIAKGRMMQSAKRWKLPKMGKIPNPVHFFDHFQTMTCPVEGASLSI